MKKLVLIAAFAFIATGNINAKTFNVSNTNELNNAINSVNDGDTIKVVQNILLMADLDTITKSITITADTNDKGKPILIISGNNRQFRVFVFDKNSNSKIENLMIIESDRYGIGVINSASITVNNVIANNNKSSGLYFESAGNYNINNFITENSSNGIIIRGSGYEKNYIKNTIVSNNNICGIELAKTTVEMDNIIINNNRWGLILYFDYRGVEALINNITVSNNALDGMRIYQFCNVYINNATINNNGRDGLYKHGGYCVLHNSTINNNKKNGIYVGGYIHS